MDTLYAVLVFLHILGACAWLGGGFVMEVMALRLGAMPTKERLQAFFEVAHYVSPRVFMPAAIITFLSGLALVFMGGAIFRELWIIIALIGVVATMILGATQIGPNVAKISALLESAGDMTEVRSLSRRLNIVTRIDLLILVIVLLDMVLKPRL